MSRRYFSLLPLLTLALAALAVPAIGEEVDLSGTWTLTILGKSPSGHNEAELTFERDGFNLVVTMIGEAGETRSIGYIDGHEIRFYYVRPTRKKDIIAKFHGHVRDDLMGGEVDMGKGPATTWMATRNGASAGQTASGTSGGGEGDSPVWGEDVDLSGRWTLQMRGESPSGMHLTKMSFRREKHEHDHPTPDGKEFNLVATMHGEKSDVECEGFVDGRIITFYYVRPTNGDEFVAKFTGQLAGALMGGEVDLGEHGETTWRATQDLE